MQTWAFARTLGLLSALLVATPAPTRSQPTTPVVPRTSPNTTFNVKRQTGRCPKTVRLWTSFRYYEGGGENTVIADTLAIAGSARLMSSGEKLVKYEAPLKKTYASCVGSATSKEYPDYMFRFKEGKVYFRVQLPPDTPSTPTAISYQNVVSQRPYIRWQIAD
jgi:hypothetical protein